jgi:hypothetical protein
MEQPNPRHVDRVFHRFGRWPHVPAEDLLSLRQSLRQAQKQEPGVAGELVILVNQELHRRGYTLTQAQPFRGRTGPH